jgi:hypothetical protein
MSNCNLLLCLPPFSALGQNKNIPIFYPNSMSDHSFGSDRSKPLRTNSSWSEPGRKFTATYISRALTLHARAREYAVCTAQDRQKEVCQYARSRSIGILTIKFHTNHLGSTNHSRRLHILLALIKTWIIRVSRNITVKNGVLACHKARVCWLCPPAAWTALPFSWQGPAFPSSMITEKNRVSGSD